MAVIAIDGPSGAGKSTVARALAGKLGYTYVDTGAMYRSIGLFVHRKGADTKDKNAVIPLLGSIDICLKYENGTQKIYVNGEDVSLSIREPQISMAASNVSAIPEVRTFLLDLQRSMAEKQDIIMDGRDIGTVIFPNAEVKIFLTAGVEIRTQRRYDEHTARGERVDYTSLLEDIKQRDFNDSTRKEAPLKPAEDAILVDSSALSFDETVLKIYKIIKDALQ